MSEQNAYISEKSAAKQIKTGDKGEGKSASQLVATQKIIPV